MVNSEPYLRKVRHHYYPGHPHTSISQESRIGRSLLQYLEGLKPSLMRRLIARAASLEENIYKNGCFSKQNPPVSARFPHVHLYNHVSIQLASIATLSIYCWCTTVASLESIHTNDRLLKLPRAVWCLLASQFQIFASTYPGEGPRSRPH